MDAKSKLLPIVAPAQGVAGECWAKAYMNLRKQAGLKSPCDVAMPMLPAPKRGVQGWEERYVTSQEMNRFMKKLFEDSGRPIAGRKVTKHSMKATELYWCAKMGVNQEHRAVLACHAVSVQGDTVLYSRDLITSALRSFTTVLSAIRVQHFCSDKSRSVMITPAAVTTAGAPCTPLPKFVASCETFCGASRPICSWHCCCGGQCAAQSLQRRCSLWTLAKQQPSWSRVRVHMTCTLLVRLSRRNV